MQKFRIKKPTSISKGVLPVDREVIPGDFGLSPEQLSEMVSKGVAEEIKPQPRKKAPTQEPVETFRPAESSESEDETA